ncbi:MAG: aldehyde dehydrogenase family protein [Methanomassiliicoccales archaeon]
MNPAIRLTMIVTSIDPRTGKEVARFRSTKLADVQVAVDRARAGHAKWWRGQKKAERVAVLRRVERAFERNSESLIDAASLETGIPRVSISSGFDSAMRGFSYYAARYERLDDLAFPLDAAAWNDTSARVVFEPHGVIGQIGVWNYPIWQTMITSIPALLAGNSIVYKPSEFVTLTGLRIAEAFHVGGVPEDVLIPIVGGKAVGRALVRSDCDAIVFTGGLETGREIIGRAGVKPLILELSGNDAGIVCDDADLQTAARGIATGTFSRAGQICIRIKRVYVNERIADPFLGELVDIASKIDVASQVGPMIRDEAREKVDTAVREAVAAGARLLLGGKKIDGPGFFYEPTVLVLDKPARIMSQETFGPVCSVMIVKDDEEAIRLANESEYGLGATIWTSDMNRADRIASSLEVGNVWVNEWGRALTCGEYFQGWKSSGIASSQERLMMFLKKKSIITHAVSEPRASWFR